MSNPSFLSNSDAKLNFNETDSNSLQLLMIGDSQCGKSTFAELITRRGFFKFIQTSNTKNIFHYGQWQSDKTKGCDIHVAVKEVKKPYTLKIYDLTGDKTQRTFLDLYLSFKYQQLNGILFCFDMTNLQTLENIKTWVKQLQQGNQCTPEIPQFQNEENESLLEQYRAYQGFTNEILAQLPILLIGLKADKIYDKKLLRNRIVKQIGQLFACTPGENLFLLSSTKAADYHAEFKRFEEILSFMSSAKVVGDSNSEKDIGNYTLNMKQIHNRISFESYGLLRRFLLNPFHRQFSRMKKFIYQCFQRNIKDE